VRQDGTMVKYFEISELKTLLRKAGFSTTDDGVCYVEKEIVNRRQAVKMDRIFIQGRFWKQVNATD